MTARVGIIGYPLGHSISPAFQQAALDELEIDARYVTWPTTPEELEARVDSLRASDVLGANVTVPHKQAVMPMLDEILPVAESIGAVNTIINRDGVLIGANTDASGFTRSLEQEAKFSAARKRALIVGAGGAARAVAFGLAWEGVSELVIVNRTAERAAELARDVSETTATDTRGGGYEDVLTDESFDLIVNSTSVGMAGGPDPEGMPPIAGLIKRGVLVCDLVYNPRETPLLALARERGAWVLGGLGMLVYQGASSFEFWTEQAPPEDIMYAAALKALM